MIGETKRGGGRRGCAPQTRRSPSQGAAVSAEIAESAESAGSAGSAESAESAESAGRTVSAESPESTESAEDIPAAELLRWHGEGAR